MTTPYGLKGFPVHIRHLLTTEFRTLEDPAWVMLCFSYGIEKLLLDFPHRLQRITGGPSSRTPYEVYVKGDSSNK